MVAVPDGRQLRTVAALEFCLRAAGVTEGRCFGGWSDGTRVIDEPISDWAVARVVQARVAAVGLDSSLFGGHSLRSGFITAPAALGGVAARIRLDAELPIRVTVGFYVLLWGPNGIILTLVLYDRRRLRRCSFNRRKLIIPLVYDKMAQFLSDHM